MPPEAEQGNGSQGQEPGTQTQGQGQEPASQQGQQGQQSQGQEPGQQSGPADISKMSPEELSSYAAKLQKDAEEARREAANYRTQYQSAQTKITEAERAKMSELEKAQADLQETQTGLQERDTRIQELEGKLEDLTKGAAIRDVLTQAGALNAATAYKVGAWTDVKLKEDGTLDAESARAAIQALRQSDPYLFRRGASADAGAGGGGAPEGGSSINDFVRGKAGR